MKIKKALSLALIYLPPLFMMALIFTMSSFGASDSDKQSGFIIDTLTSIFPDLKSANFLVRIVRKSAHFLEYALFGFFMARLFKKNDKAPFLSIIFCGFYAMTDEFHQTFIAGRSGEITDVLIDTAGATCGALIYLGLKCLILKIQHARSLDQKHKKC